MTQDVPWYSSFGIFSKLFNIKTRTTITIIIFFYKHATSNIYTYMYIHTHTHTYLNNHSWSLNHLNNKHTHISRIHGAHNHYQNSIWPKHFQIIFHDIWKIIHTYNIISMRYIILKPNKIMHCMIIHHYKLE